MRMPPFLDVIQFSVVVLLGVASAVVIGVTVQSHVVTRAPERPLDSGGVTVPNQVQSLEGAGLKGSRIAPVVLMEYGDFECQCCGIFARNTLPRIQSAYVDSGRVLVAFRHLTLDAIHRFAFLAAKGSICAGRQGRFWPMHEALFANQDVLPQGLSALAAVVGLSPSQFDRCLRDPDVAAQVSADGRLAAELGITTTPTFLVGLAEGGKLRVKRVLSGARRYEDFVAVFDELLATR